jgi:alanine racemase
MPTEIKQDRWIEINLDAIEANAREIKNHLPAACRLLAVVKADAYGLGAKAIAHTLADQVDMLAVSTCEEGVELRQSGSKTPILVFIPPSDYTAELFGKYGLTASIDSPQSLQALAKAGCANQPCHLKINSGMNRLGINIDEAAALAAKISKNPASRLRGVYSHLALAAENATASRQIAAFKKALTAIKEKNIDYGIAHMANSTAILRLPEACFDMVRAGTILYGQSPVALPCNWQLHNPWQACCRIIAVRELKKGDAVGYGGDFVAAKNMRIAVIPFGYADGFALETNTRNGNIGSVFKQSMKNAGRIMAQKPLHYAIYEHDGVKDQLPIVGRVGMQLSAVDISGQPLEKGDVLKISLRRTCTNSRISRIYYKDQKFVSQRSIIDAQDIEK